MTYEALTSRLAGVKFHLTPMREAVINILVKSAIPLSHDTIMGQLSSDADRVTVYRIINKLVELGVARKFEGDDKRSYFELSLNAPHAHFICQKCQTIICLDEPLVTLPDGYHINDVTIRGLCPTCH